jgi:hypothetical protein
VRTTAAALLVPWSHTSASRLLCSARAAAGTSSGGAAVAVVRLVRMLKAERYVQAFTVFDDIFKDNVDVLAVTGTSLDESRASAAADV